MLKVGQINLSLPDQLVDTVKKEVGMSTLMYVLKQKESMHQLFFHFYAFNQF